MFILHYIIEYVGNLCMRSQKGDTIFLGSITCVPNSFSIRRKHFAGNFSACVITNNEFI